MWKLTVPERTFRIHFASGADSSNTRFLSINQTHLIRFHDCTENEYIISHSETSQSCPGKKNELYSFHLSKAKVRMHFWMRVISGQKGWSSKLASKQELHCTEKSNPPHFFIWIKKFNNLRKKIETDNKNCQLRTVICGIAFYQKTRMNEKNMCKNL